MPVDTKILSQGRIALLGLGVENRALAAWLANHGCSFTICDENPACRDTSDPWSTAVEAWHLGERYLEDLDRFDILYRSPGMYALHPLLAAARRTETMVTSQTQLFLDNCPASVVGVTGTKGKGTTAAMLASVLHAAGRPVRLAGNIGTPPMTFLDELDPNETVILELSSFQLQDLNRSPTASIVLPIDTDHLDVHRDRAEYVEAKRSICRFQGGNDWVVFSSDNATARQVAGLSAGKQISSTATSSIPDRGTWVEDGFIRWRDRDIQSLTPVEAIPVRGRHNLVNASAASAAAALLGVSPAQIEAGLRAFTPLPHRLEEVATIDGVLFVNDSLGTTPVAAAAALEAYADRSLVAIVGGASKKTDYEPLGQALARHAHAIVLLGEEGPRIAEAAQAAGYAGAVAQAAGMEIAVGVARRLAPSDGVVVLAPGCASFGMFENYAARGIAFRDAVAQLSAE